MTLVQLGVGLFLLLASVFAAALCAICWVARGECGSERDAGLDPDDFTVECMDCKTVMHRGNNKVSHGICETCRGERLKELNLIH